MGLSSSKQTTKPVYDKQIMGAANAAQGVYDANQESNQNIANQVQGLIPGLIEKYQGGDSTIDAARGYSEDVLGGKYLDDGNPYLNDMLSKTGDSIRNQIQASMGTRGRAYGSDYGNILSRALAENETNLRYTDYGNERGRMDQHAGLSTSYGQGEAAPVNSILNAAQLGSELPYAGVNNLTRNIGGLLGQYTITKQKQPLGGLLGGLAGSALSGWASGGFG